MNNKIKEVSFANFCDTLIYYNYNIDYSNNIMFLKHFYISEGIFLKEIKSIKFFIDPFCDLDVDMYRSLIINYPGIKAYYKPYDDTGSIKTMIPKSLFWDEYTI
jgi:hypothetical protein